MKHTIFIACFLLSIVACQEQVEDPKTALYQLFEEEQTYSKTAFPSWSDTSSVRTYPDLSIENEKRHAEQWRNILTKLKDLPKNNLSDQDQINYEMFQFILADRIAQIENEAYLTPITADGGFHVNFVYMRNQFSFDNLSAYQRYIKVLESFKNYAADNMLLLKEGIKKKRTLPQAVLKGYESYLNPHIVENAAESYFYAPFLNMPKSISEDQQTMLKMAAKKAITNSVVVGYRAFKDFLETEYKPLAATEIGLSAQPNGKAIYNQRLEYYTTLKMTAEDIFEKGQSEVARIKADMVEIMKELDYQGSFADFLNFLRTDSQFYALSPRHLLMEASYHSKKIDGKLPTYFKTLPRLPYGVDPVPAAIAPKYTTGRYSPGSARNYKSGTYWVNTFKLESRPLFVLPALTLHEAVPGHHLQISLADEMEEVPEFRRATYLSCYGEGWALYCEWLGDEMGIYETPYEHFGRMTYEMWRACRLVVDVGIHAKGWTRQEALDYMIANTALSLHEITTEVDRYIGWPGQAVSYKIGELKIRELRAKAEAALGNEFNIRDFHDVVLKNGSVPLFVLERMVDTYITKRIEDEDSDKSVL